jgi:hypothetical protein
LPFLLELPGLRSAAQAQTRRLLRVLQLRQRALPAEAAGTELLRLNRGVLYAPGAAALFGASTRTTSTGTGANRMRIRIGTNRSTIRIPTTPTCITGTRTS